MNLKNARFSIALIITVLLCSSSSRAMILEYQGRYNCQDGPDHIMDVVGISGSRALVASNQGIALVDLTALPHGGTQTYLDRLSGGNVRNVYVKNDEYVYVNSNRQGANFYYGFGIVKIVGDTLQQVGSFYEEGVLYEKMCISSGYLYIAVHNKGIRIYSLADPENPVLTGSLETGFIDAWAIDVNGTSAYVADGGGGLKVVDVSDPSHPVLIGGETMEIAVGTSEDVLYRSGKIYVAAGGAGLAEYDAEDISDRTHTQTSGFAKDLCWIGDYLGVATASGVEIFQVGTDEPSLVAHEIATRRENNALLRICSAVGSDNTGTRVFCANWNYMDYFELKDEAQSSQPDINSSKQRIRFPFGGGSETVTLSNNGAGTLDIINIQSTQPSFTVDFTAGTIPPGESMTIDIAYDGSSPGSARIRVATNDPDEQTLPIQVFGATSDLDPGEPSAHFTLASLRRDPTSGDYIEEPFTLTDHLGKVLWFQVYGSW